VQINHPDTAPDYYGDSGGGVGVREFDGRPSPRVLLTGEEDTLNCYRFNYNVGGGAGDGFSPRHRHTFDQVRYFLTGEFQYGDQVVPAGLIGYFPESTFYGPLIRTTGEGLNYVDVQFGGAGGNGYPSLEQRRKGSEALLAKGGTLEGGMYITVDENGQRHNQDGFEALWEAVTGKKVTYSEPRYTDQVFMNPDHFAWLKDPELPGVARKTVGVFTEREVRIGFIQLDKGASIPFGEAPAPEILYVNHGAMSYNGTSHPECSAFGTTADEQPHTLTADEATELLYIKLPTF
jgi:hypothetical protein